MIGDSKYAKYLNFEEYMKDYFEGVYVPPLKNFLTKDGYDSLLNLAERCTRDTAPLIQGYHFNSDIAMYCFIRAVMYDMFDNIIKPLPYINCQALVNQYFSNNAILSKYVFPPVLLISYGLYELNHIYNFDLTNKLCEMRRQEDKPTFILSLKSQKEIKALQEQYNRFNPQKQKPIKEFCVPLITVDKVTIHDTKGILRQWEGDSIIQPKITEEVDFSFLFDGIEIEE